MDRQTELDLIERCAKLAEDNGREMTREGQSEAVRYTDEKLFAKEQSYMRKLPVMAAHSSELPEKGSYIAKDWLEGFPLLLTRDMDGEVHAFANACRHRGSRLEENGSGCKRRLMCPYHAWTYDIAGQLKTLPHKSGFPSIDPSEVKLKELPSAEVGGFIWVQREGEAPLDIESYLAGLLPDFGWLGSEDHVLFAETEKVWDANWKILVEGGIESYHFKIAHRDTIAPLFRDALSVFDEFGPHFRSILAKESVKGAMDVSEDERDIREYANVLYSIFPMNSILVQPDHFALITNTPMSAGKTHVRIQTFIPKEAPDTEKLRAHWQANFDFTLATLVEDFELAEKIQKGMETGASDKLFFGKFEDALTRFHEINDEMLAQYTS